MYSVVNIELQYIAFTLYRFVSLAPQFFLPEPLQTARSQHYDDPTQPDGSSFAFFETVCVRTILFAVDMVCVRGSNLQCKLQEHRVSGWR
jgi:hypothetical protein